MLTKKEILQKCRDILHSSPIGWPIKQEDFNYLIQNIFPLHKEWDIKRNGCNVKSIIVRRNPNYGNKQFAMILDNDTIVDISFIECINGERLRDEVKEACKKAVPDLYKNEDNTVFEAKVRSWIKNFDLGEITIGKYINHTKMEFINQDLIDNFRNWYEGV